MLNNFLSDLFPIIQDVNIASYADDNTIYQSGNNIDDAINGLQVSAEKRFLWSTDNQMKGKTGKCYFIVCTNNSQEIQVRESLIKRSNCEKLLGVNIDYKLTFDNHVNNLSKKANNKLRALTRATSYMNIEKKKIKSSFFQCTIELLFPYMDPA